MFPTIIQFHTMSFLAQPHFSRRWQKNHSCQLREYTTKWKASFTYLVLGGKSEGLKFSFWKLKTKNKFYKQWQRNTLPITGRGANFSSEAMEVRRNYTIVFKCWKKRTIQPRMKIYFKNQEEIKIFWNEGRLREYAPSISNLKEWLKEVR